MQNDFMPHPRNEEVSQWLKDYAAHLQGEGKADRTIGSYISDVKRFLDHHPSARNRQLDQTTRIDVSEFLAEVNGQHLKPATFNKLINSLSCFFRYLPDTGTLPKDRALIIPKRDRVRVAAGSEPEVTVLTDRQVDLLLAYLTRSELVTQRDRLLVLFLLYTGCRVSEAVGVRLRDLDLLAGLVTVRGKGNKLREVPLRPDLAEEIQKYLSGERKESRFHDSEYLFVSQRAGVLNRDTVNTILERLERLGQFPFHLHPHLFRHTFASKLISRGVPLPTVQRLVGHASVQTTALFYVNTSRKDKQNAVNLL